MGHREVVLIQSPGKYCPGEQGQAVDGYVMSSKSGKVLQIISSNKTTNGIIIFNLDSVRLNSMIAGMEESHGEVSDTLCTTPSNTLNTVSLSRTWGIFGNLCYQNKARDNALTRQNVTLRFLRFQNPEGTLVLFRCRRFDVFSKEPEVACGSVHP